MDKEETFAIIRSLLTSTKSYLDLYALSKDFRNETGTNIPLFGYKNLGDLLCSAPEKFLVTGEYPNQKVRPVINEKSSHIVSLVQKQKTKNCNNRNKTFCYDKYYFPNSNTSCKNVNDKKIFKSVEENLTDYLMSCSNGATFEDIQKNVEGFENWESTMRVHNIIAFVKKFPQCIFYEDKFYALESFQKMISRKTALNEP